MTTDTQTTGAIGNALITLDPDKAVEVADSDRSRIEEIKQTVEIDSTTSVLDFGTATESNVARFADTVLDQVMSRDMGPVHEKLAEIKLVAKGLSPQSLNKEQASLVGRLFFNLKREITKFTDRFKTARTQIDSIARELEDQIEEVNLGIIKLDKLFNENLDNFRDLSLHIVAGHELLEHYRGTVIPKAQTKAEEMSNTPDAMVYAQKLRDLKAAIDRFDRKIMNLEKSKAIAFASMPTIRQVQQTGITLVEEMKMAMSHAIPAWKSAMVIYVEQLRQKVGLETLEAMTDFTNSQLKAMAEQLDENTVKIHEQTSRGIADVEAITETIGSLINTLDKVDGLERDARNAREQGRAALAKAEADLRAHQLKSSSEIETIEAD